MKILIVDDNAHVREELCKSLDQKDYDISLAENGLAALSLAQKSDFDFVITDYKMPFMDGIKLIENLFEELDFQPNQILLLTTDSSSLLVHKVKQLNIKHLAKPVTADKVSKAMLQVSSAAAA